MSSKRKRYPRLKGCFAKATDKEPLEPAADLFLQLLSK